MVTIDAAGKIEKADENRIGSVQEIMQELDDGKLDTNKLMEKAEKIRAKKIKDREKRKEAERKKQEKIKTATEKEAEKTKKDPKEDFEESVKDLKEKNIIELTDEMRLEEFKTYPMLRNVYFNVAVNQPTKVLELLKIMGIEYEDKKKISRPLWKLRRMGLVKEDLVCEFYWKNKLNKQFKLKMPVAKEEIIMINKIGIAKETDERTRNKLIGNLGFWSLTDLGKEFLSIAKADLEK